MSGEGVAVVSMEYQLKHIHVIPFPWPTKSPRHLPNTFPVYLWSLSYVPYVCSLGQFGVGSGDQSFSPHQQVNLCYRPVLLAASWA